MSMTLSPTGALAADPARARALRDKKRQATGLLVVMLALFLATLVGEDRGVVGFLRAGFEASLVGGLADWFAVTALFRHPMGVPIPKTAVIPKGKDEFGRMLGRFVEENLLTPEMIIDRIREAGFADRAATWLADERHAAVAAGYVLDFVHKLADELDEDTVERLIEDGLRRAADRVEPGPLAAKALTWLMDSGHHQEAFDAVLRGAVRFLHDHRDTLRARFAEEAPKLLPGFLEKKIFSSLFDGAVHLIEEVLADPAHPFRAEVDSWLARQIEQLETSPETQARIARARDELLAQGVPHLAASLWRDARAALATQAADPDSELRRRLTGFVAYLGRSHRDDPVRLARAEEGVEKAAAWVVERYHPEVSSIVDAAISRWDGEETARQLELLLGRDLQGIRMNGTLIGGLAGLGIHALGVVFG